MSLKPPIVLTARRLFTVMNVIKRNFYKIDLTYKKELALEEEKIFYKEKLTDGTVIINIQLLIKNVFC